MKGKSASAQRVVGRTSPWPLSDQEGLWDEVIPAGECESGRSVYCGRRANVAPPVTRSRPDAKDAVQSGCSSLPRRIVRSFWKDLQYLLCSGVSHPYSHSKEGHTGRYCHCMVICMVLCSTLGCYYLSIQGWRVWRRGRGG